MSKTSTSGDSSAANWGSISYGSSTSSDTNFAINDKKLRKDLEGIYKTFKETDEEVNKGRKVCSCRRCGLSYYEDEGISEGYCGLDCKYFQCIIEEGKNGENL